MTEAVLFIATEATCRSCTAVARCCRRLLKACVGVDAAALTSAPLCASIAPSGVAVSSVVPPDRAALRGCRVLYSNTSGQILWNTSPSGQQARGCSAVVRERAERKCVLPQNKHTDGDGCRSDGLEAAERV